MHRPLDPNTGKPIALDESTGAGKGARTPNIKQNEGHKIPKTDTVAIKKQEKKDA